MDLLFLIKQIRPTDRNILHHYLAEHAMRECIAKEKKPLSADAIAVYQKAIAEYERRERSKPSWRKYFDSIRHRKHILYNHIIRWFQRKWPTEFDDLPKHLQILAIKMEHELNRAE